MKFPRNQLFEITVQLDSEQKMIWCNVEETKIILDFRIFE